MPYKPRGTTIAATVELGGRQVPYSLRVSPRARYMRLEITPADGLRVVVPKRYDKSQLDALLLAKGEWILKYLARFAAEAAKHVDPPELAHGSLVPYRGRVHTLRVLPAGATARSSSVDLAAEEIVVRLHARDEGRLRHVLEAWMRRRARAAILAEMRDLDPEGTLAYGRLFVMDQQTRWGGCSARGNLSFSWRLVLAPPAALRYIVAHELAHLKHHNHSARFWGLVARLCPDYEAQRRWLKDNGSDLRF